MKSGSLASALVVGDWLAAGAGGHPLNFNKRKLVTEVMFVTETVADAVVYVDETGAPYLTSTVERVISIPTTVADSTTILSSTAPTASSPVEPASAPLGQSSATPVPPSSSTSLSEPSVAVPNAASTPPPPPPSQAVAPAPNSKAPTSSGLEQAPPSPPPSSSAMPVSPPSSPEPSSVLPLKGSPGAQYTSAPWPKPSAQSDDQFPLGITYDTFKAKSDCKTPDGMRADFEKMKDFKIIRIYGNDCGVIPIAVQQARKNGQSLMAGVYEPIQNITEVVNALSDAIKRYNEGDWSIIKLVSVENERVNSHVMKASDALRSIADGRQVLRSAGYLGPVGVVETAPVYVNNTSICDEADIVGVNIHTFFDPNTEAKDAGTFVRSEVARVKQACNNKRVVVTESGWPHQGTSHDKAVVSQEAQKVAIESIKTTINHDLFLFNAFDSPWKDDSAGTFNSEKYWGILS